MAEMTYTTVSIGGRIRMKHAEEIADIINGSFSELFNDGKTLEEITNASKAGERFTIAGQVNYGNPEELRSYLATKRLPYVITYCAGREFNAGGYAYRRGRDEVEFEANEDGDPTVTLRDLQLHAKAGRSLKAVIKTIENCQHESVPAIVIKD